MPWGPPLDVAHECNKFSFSTRSLARRHALLDISARASRAECFTFEPSYSTPVRSPSPSLIPEPSRSAGLFARAAQIPPIEQELYFARGAICPFPDSALVDDARAAEYAELRSPIPQDYHDLLSVLSKQKRTTLPPRCPHHHHIDLMDHTTPHGPIDSLSKVSNNYENLNNQFIRPSQSSIGPPVLFIRKRIILSTSL